MQQEIGTTTKEKGEVLCHLPQVTLFSSHFWLLCLRPASLSAGCLGMMHVSKGAGLWRTWIKFLTDKDSADVMGEKARHVLVNESSPLDSSAGTPCAPTPLLFLGGSWRSSDKRNVIQSALSSDMWHQKALRRVPVPYSYILMLVLKLSEPTCGGSVSSYFHIFDCTDHS